MHGSWGGRILDSGRIICRRRAEVHLSLRGTKRESRGIRLQGSIVLRLCGILESHPDKRRALAVRMVAPHAADTPANRESWPHRQTARKDGNRENLGYALGRVGA